MVVDSVSEVLNKKEDDVEEGPGGLGEPISGREASEQAASPEETSASMEEMSSITKQNAGNSNHADKTHERGQSRCQAGQ